MLTLAQKGRLYQRYLCCLNTRKDMIAFPRHMFDQLLDQVEVIIHPSGDALLYLIKDDICYLTFIMSTDEANFKSLLQSLDEVVKEKKIPMIKIHFHNPIKIPWMPLPEITHPNYPGFPVDDNRAQWFFDSGYLIHSTEQIFYINLEEASDFLLDQRVHFYQEQDEDALKLFIAQIHHPEWENVLFDVMHHPEKPLIVAWLNNEIVGFTGPLSVEESKRGYFAGIMVLDKARNLGLGKALFHRLALELKDMGADYLTLFTGKDNPAKAIYLSLGGEVVKEFYTLKKITG